MATGLVSGLALALVRIPPALALGSVDPAWAEQLLWGLGGFLFGLLLAAAWSLPFSAAKGAAQAMGWALPASPPHAGAKEGGTSP
jgi:hypothetical protein